MIDGPTACICFTNFKHRSINTPKSHLFACGILTVSSVKSPHIIFFSTPSFTADDAPSSPSGDVSATCWSSRICFYPPKNSVSCLSDGLVRLGHSASLSSSAACSAWTCWATRSGSGSCSSRGEKKEMQLEWEGLEEDRQTNWRNIWRELLCYHCIVLVPVHSLSHQLHDEQLTFCSRSDSQLFLALILFPLSPSPPHPFLHHCSPH